MIDVLIERDEKQRKCIAVVGDPLVDIYIHGQLLPSQDGCQKFVEESSERCNGGAAGAARQLQNWRSFAYLYGPMGHLPIKVRYLVGDKIVFRHDIGEGCALSDVALTERRQQVIEGIQRGYHDAVLISDYDKGFLDVATIRAIIDLCVARDIPVVADGKKPPNVYLGAILKVNGDYFMHHAILNHLPASIVTFGDQPPFIDDDTVKEELDDLPPVVCRNHCGAGDCFAAHLTLALAHGIPLREAAKIAHSAGRVYVQHQHGRPPRPEEIAADLHSRVSR